MEQENTQIIEVVEEKRGPGRPKGSYKKVVDRSSFLRAGGHEFDKIIKKTERDIADVMNTLAEIVQHKDSTNSEKIKAGEILLNNYTKMVEQRNKDEITRKIAEIRVNNGAGSGSTEDDEEADDDTPLIDFNNVAAEFKDVQAPSQEQLLQKSDKES